MRVIEKSTHPKLGMVRRIHTDSMEELASLPRPADRDPSDTVARIWSPTPEEGRKGLKAEGPKPGWAGSCPTLKELGALYRDGWQEGVNKALTAMGDLPPLPGAVTRRRRPKWKDQGGEIHQERVWEGRLDTAWRSAERQKLTGQTHLHLYIGLGGSSYVDPGAWFWRGAAAAWLADAAEASGRRVKITGYTVSRGMFKSGIPNLITTTGIKEYQEPLDLSRLVAITAHASSLRTGQFALWTYLDNCYGSLGHPVHNVHPEPETKQPEDLILDGVWNQLDATKWVESARTKLDDLG